MGAMPPGRVTTRLRESERGIYTEKKLGDELLAVWDEDDLPADARLTQVTLIPYRGEKVVLTWHDGKTWLPEGAVREGEPAEDAVRRIASEQAGILDPVIVHLGHFRCRATSYSKTQAPGTITYQGLYGLEVGSLADFPSDERYERRIVLQRELNQLLRSSYVERRREFIDALDAWLLARLKAQAAAEGNAASESPGR